MQTKPSAEKEMVINRGELSLQSETDGNRAMKHGDLVSMDSASI